jgi:hypothetical protein
MSGTADVVLFEQLVAQANQLFLSTADSVVINGVAVPTMSKIYAQFLASIPASVTLNSIILAWAYTQAFQAATATRDSNGAITTANIVWPDGTAGVFTTDVASTAFPGAIDAWHATYASSPAKTITQPAVTRDASGAVIAQPAITIV